MSSTTDIHINAFCETASVCGLWWCWRVITVQLDRFRKKSNNRICIWLTLLILTNLLSYSYILHLYLILSYYNLTFRPFLFSVSWLTGSYCGQSFSQTARPGDNVTFSWLYPDVLETDMKSVYRVTSQIISAIIFTYTEYETDNRYVLHVSTTDKVISMSISGVTADDGGLYLCGFSSTGSSYVSVFGEIQLQVTGRNVVSSVYIRFNFFFLKAILFKVKLPLKYWKTSRDPVFIHMLDFFPHIARFLLFTFNLQLYLIWKSWCKLLCKERKSLRRFNGQWWLIQACFYLSVSRSSGFFVPLHHCVCRRGSAADGRICSDLLQAVVHEHKRYFIIHKNY